jgi:hypothetical protein
MSATVLKLRFGPSSGPRILTLYHREFEQSAPLNVDCSCDAFESRTLRDRKSQAAKLLRILPNASQTYTACPTCLRCPSTSISGLYFRASGNAVLAGNFQYIRRALRDTLAFLPSGFVESLKARETGGVISRTVAPFKHGQAIAINEGPFRRSCWPYSGDPGTRSHYSAVEFAQSANKSART